MAPFDDSLGARERQVLDAVLMLGEATVAEARAKIPDPPSANAVRTMLGTLVQRGLLKKNYRGRAAIYRAADDSRSFARESLDRVLRVFHGGSIASALRQHLSDPSHRPSRDELESLHQLIEEARAKKGERE